MRALASVRRAITSTPPSTIAPPRYRRGPGWSPQNAMPSATANTGTSSNHGVTCATGCRCTSRKYRPWPSSEDTKAAYRPPAQATQLAEASRAKLPGSNSALAASNGSRLITAIQPCWLYTSSPRRPFISTVPIASSKAETSITSSAIGRSSTSGSKPSTSTPPKLSAIATPVRQAKRSPSSAHASRVVIGT